MLTLYKMHHPKADIERVYMELQTALDWTDLRPWIYELYRVTTLKKGAFLLAKCCVWGVYLANLRYQSNKPIRKEALRQTFTGTRAFLTD